MTSTFLEVGQQSRTSTSRKPSRRRIRIAPVVTPFGVWVGNSGHGLGAWQFTSQLPVDKISDRPWRPIVRVIVRLTLWYIPEPVVLQAMRPKRPRSRGESHV